MSDLHKCLFASLCNTIPRASVIPTKLGKRLPKLSPANDVVCFLPFRLEQCYQFEPFDRRRRLYMCLCPRILSLFSHERPHEYNVVSSLNHARAPRYTYVCNCLTLGYDFLPMRTSLKKRVISTSSYVGFKRLYYLKAPTKSMFHAPGCTTFVICGKCYWSSEINRFVFCA